MGTVEDTFVMPSSWLRAIRPRRGGAPAGFSPAPAWAAGIATLVAGRPSLRRSLTHPGPPTFATPAWRTSTSAARSPNSTGRRRRRPVGAGTARGVDPRLGQVPVDRDRPHTVGELHPVTVSGIIRDLREVVQ